MLKITTIGSGSSGNCYILECQLDNGEREAIILEAGLSPKRVQKALDFNLRYVKGCLITHEHGDHAHYALKLNNNGIMIYATEGTLSALGLKDTLLAQPIQYKYRERTGKLFSIVPFETEHDAQEPCGFLIDCADGNRVLFATDTYFLRYRFPDVTLFMIECNYDEAILKRNIKDGVVNAVVGKRVRKSHMSITQCIDTLKANDLSKTKAIVLVHLSSSNSNKDVFQKRVKEATGKLVYVAQKEETITIY